MGYKKKISINWKELVMRETDPFLVNSPKVSPRRMSLAIGPITGSSSAGLTTFQYNALRLIYYSNIQFRHAGWLAGDARSVSNSNWISHALTPGTVCLNLSFVTKSSPFRPGLGATL